MTEDEIRRINILLEDLLKKLQALVDGQAAVIRCLERMEAKRDATTLPPGA